jgi:hypothetical protein
MKPEDLKRIALARVKGAKHLIDKKDWDGAVQMMGLALECALKSVVCKTLKLPTYPLTHPKDKKVQEFFMTHSFDRLLLVSGLSDIFSAAGDSFIFDNWSEFTLAYQGEWTAMRYIDGAFDETKAMKLCSCLYGNSNGIIRIIAKKKKW